MGLLRILLGSDLTNYEWMAALYFSFLFLLQLGMMIIRHGRLVDLHDAMRCFVVVLADIRTTVEIDVGCQK